MKKIGVYKISNPKGKIYIGQSKDIDNRAKMYRLMHCKPQTKLFRSIVKYGWDNHKFEVIQYCDFSELDALEIYYIQLYNTFNTESGLNLRSGGYRGKLNDEARRKISEAKKGTTITEETRAKLRARPKYKFPEHIIKKRIETRKINGYKHSKETIEKIKSSQKGYVPTQETINKLKEAWKKRKDRRY